MLCREVNRGKCKTYLLACEQTGRAALIDAIKDRAVVTICRAGVRSATAAAILTGLGFEQVWNLRGGMLDWNDAGLPVER